MSIWTDEQIQRAREHQEKDALKAEVKRLQDARAILSQCVDGLRQRAEAAEVALRKVADLALNMSEDHSCFTGDCPHERREECVGTILREFLDAAREGGEK